jgi:hypothetical protein
MGTQVDAYLQFIPPFNLSLITFKESTNLRRTIGTNTKATQLQIHAEHSHAVTQVLKHYHYP